MAAVTSAGSAWTTIAGNKTVTATPAIGDLIVIICATTGLAGGTISCSDDQGGAYSQIDVDRTGFSTTGVLCMMIRTSLIPANSSTVFTATQTGSSGGGLVVYRISGMSIVGEGAVRGAGGESSGGAGATPAPVLLRRVGETFSGTQAALTGNVMIGAVANGSNPAGIAPPGSWTEAPTPDLGYNSPATGLETAFRNSGETNSTITWGGTSATGFASMAIELDTSVPIIDPIGMQELQRDNPYTSVIRAANW